ncbi:MAG TPA: adenylate/guanylate cyclase domain-containing protein [Nitrososphaerales archaeon]|nr:adenylate/guanylate cyclase domain-containing protein [Nitrososphaerales archaeon]
MPEGARRLAAIMFTDMVGYTALGQKNEELSLTLVAEQRKVIRPIIARHNGREVKTIGDAFLVEFLNALDAVRCAYDIQRAIREFNISMPSDQRLHLRIGVHDGDVVESNGDISGDAVNVASRIEPLAEDGGVCLTQDVYNHVRNKIELPMSSLGPKTLKNVVEPVEVYRMVMPWEIGTGAKVKALEPRRIAVLPLENISPSPADAYISDGLTEELISTLSRINGLRVIARTSAMRYKGSGKGVNQIGRELGAGSLIEGSVRTMRNKVRISVQLIDSATEEHLWAGDYDREIGDVFEVQKDIATKVAEELRVKLQPDERQRLGRRETQNSGAYTLYLKGRHYWNERTEDGFRKAREYFEKAIELDPGYGAPYSGLADTYHTMASFFGRFSSDVMLQNAKKYAEKALELDGTLAEAQVSLADVSQDLGDWLEAEKRYKLAIGLNPSYALAHFWYSILLTWHQRHDEAIAEARRAQELDPFSPSISIAVGQALTYARRYDEAVEWLDNVILTNPGVPNPHFIRGLAYLYEGMYEQALADAKEAMVLKNDRVIMLSGLAEAGLGHREKAEEVLRELEQKEALYITRATLQLALGKKEEAIRTLEAAYQKREIDLGWLNVIPYYDVLRDDESFVSLLQNIRTPKGPNHREV